MIIRVYLCPPVESLEAFNAGQASAEKELDELRLAVKALREELQRRTSEAEDLSAACREWVKAYQQQKRRADEAERKLAEAMGPLARLRAAEIERSKAVQNVQPAPPAVQGLIELVGLFSQGGAR